MNVGLGDVTREMYLHLRVHSFSIILAQAAMDPTSKVCKLYLVPIGYQTWDLWHRFQTASMVLWHNIPRQYRSAAQTAEQDHHMNNLVPFY